MGYDMAGNYIMIDIPIMEAKERFFDLNVTSESNEYFQEGKWTILFDCFAEEFDIAFLLKLARENNLIQVYFSEDNSEGSLIVINQGKVIRELYDYSEHMEHIEENKNIGLLDLEGEYPLKDWVDISCFIGKFLDIYK